MPNNSKLKGEACIKKVFSHRHAKINMIQVVAKNRVKEEYIEAFLKLARKLVEDTNTKDKGCIQYELFQDIQDPNVFTILEQWEDMDALKAHMGADHFTETMALTKDFYQQPSEVNLYQKV